MKNKIFIRGGGLIALTVLTLAGCADLSAPRNDAPSAAPSADDWALGVASAPSGLTERVRNTVKAEFSDAKVEGEKFRETDEIWQEKLGPLADNPDFQRAEQLRQDRQFAAARDLFLNLTKAYPSASGVYRRLGDCYYNLLELHPAVAAYETASRLNPENYFALRGLAFAHLYYGHSLWDAREFVKAHEQYGLALRLLQRCTRIYPADFEALFGRSMAAEGASRRLYQSALALRQAGKAEQAAVAARNCLDVIEEGVETGRQRLRKNLDEVAPKNVIGGLAQRRALLCHEFSALGNAAQSMEQAVNMYEAILKTDPDNALAKQEAEKCRALLEKWNADAGAEDRNN
ncbi:hypothetical protein FACS1894139_08840 [Planctomycetales bacterium]|nr:hypothetical protein FACS1894108_01200 [Planctomycetales bacterium]GHT05282.1 hypothetical protein FACS1894139_08840 [Planctomycetales bacterium]